MKTNHSKEKRVSYYKVIRRFSRAGVGYTKLVKRDKSPVLSKLFPAKRR